MARKSSYKPIYCKKLLDMSREGKSLQQVAAEIGVTPRTMRNWKEKYPEFKEACAEGLVLACAWWENEIQQGMNDKDKPKHWATSIIYTMKCRFKEFGYNERQEQSIEITNKHETMSNEDIDRALKAITDKIKDKQEHTASESKNQEQSVDVH